MTAVSSVYRHLPAVQRLLTDPRLQALAACHGHAAVAEACRGAIDELRRRIAAGELEEAAIPAACAELPASVLRSLAEQGEEAYPAVVNATGVLLHTNLGRAPLPASMPASLASYLALEYDLGSGARGQRLAPLRERIARVCGAEAAVMVNNNAAALLLLLAAHARDREVIVSRSQLIEIGGSFRLPEVMAASGALLREVGCTNRTHLRDYADAICERTGAILVAHQSNFRIVGFTTSPPVAELAELARAHRLPLIVDQGHGALHDLARWGLGEEPTVAALLEAGADAVCFSGDKLLGGPQAGVIVGRSEWVEPLGRHPLYRALRPDKVALVLMDRVLRAHGSGRLREIPLYAMLDTPLEALKRRARSLGRRLRTRGITARGRATRSVLGGGTTPDESVPSFGLAIPGRQRLADLLRSTRPPVIARIEGDQVICDLRTVRPDQDRALEACIVEAWHQLQTETADNRD